MAEFKIMWAVKKRVGTVALAIVMALSVWPSIAPAQRPANPTGTFSSMYYNSESTDLRGIEIRIVYTRKGFQGTIQDAEGEPGELIPIEVTIDDGNNFTISFTDPSTNDPVTISGRITKAGLEKKTKWGMGGYLLKRAPSYWDERRASPP